MVMAAFDLELSKNLDLLEESTLRIDALLNEYKDTGNINPDILSDILLNHEKCSKIIFDLKKLVRFHPEYQCMKCGREYSGEKCFNKECQKYLCKECQKYPLIDEDLVSSLRYNVLFFCESTCKSKFFSEDGTFGSTLSTFGKSTTITKIKDLKKGDIIFDKSINKYGKCIAFSDGLMIKKPLRIIVCCELSLSNEFFLETSSKFQIYGYYDSIISKGDGIFYV